MTQSRGNRRIIQCLVVVLAALLLGANRFTEEQHATRVYIGTYTGGASRGIYLLQFDQSSGKWIGDPELAAATENPSFLAMHPSGRVLYAVNETANFEAKSSGSVSAFAIDRQSGRLTLLNTRASEGADPCHIIVDRAARNVLVANYTGGSVAVLPISADGRLGAPSSVRRHAGTGPVRDRQEGPHAHAILLDAAERFGVSADLGADRVFIDRFDTRAGRLQPGDPDSVALPPGSGPRHLAWHPSGRALYVMNELTSTVSALRFNPEHGALEVIQTVSARAAGATVENTGAEIVVSRDGRFVYSSNRGDDDIAVFRVDPSSFRLSVVGRVSTGGHEPRNFAIDPSGRWLIAANQKSNSLVVFRIDQATGLLAEAGARATVTEPVCVLFDSRFAARPPQYPFEKSN